MKMIFESKEPITLTTEDSGCAMLIDNGEPEFVGESENTIAVEIRSWDENGWEYPLQETTHADIRKLEGKRIRVTIEVLD